MDLALIGFKSDTSGLTKAERGLDKLANKGVKTEKTLKKSTGAISMGFARIASTLATVVTSGAALNKLVGVTRQFDVLNAQLVTATGSAEKASDAFFAIEEFAKTTPYDLAQATTAFNKLVNLGLNPSEEALLSYGNTASAMGKPLDQLIEAVADASVAEFERLKEFGIKAKNQGDTIAFTFRGVTEEVGNNAEEIQNYLMALGENEFAGSMANRMATLDGAVSNLGDSWDKLFLTVSQAGVGDMIEAGIRDSIDALDDLTLKIASGEVEARIDALTSKFDGFGEDIVFMLDTLGTMWTEGTQGWGLDGEKSAGYILDAFKSMPENIRSIIQLVAVEIGSLVDYGLIHGKAFAEVLGVQIGLLVENSKIWGLEIANALNPFSDDIDYSADYVRAAELAAEMTNSILESANRQAEGISSARRATIVGIMDEREAALNSFDAQIEGAKDLTKEYKKMMAERKKASKGTLASSQIKKQTKVVEAQNKELDKLLDSIYGVGEAWSETGNVIVNAFGDISSVLNNYVSELEKIGKTEEKLAEEKKKYQPDSNYYKEITAAEEELADKRTRANLSSFASIAGAAGDMFGEQTKAREAFHKIEMALTAVEIAMTLQKAGANALAAISSAFAAPWPINFASGAAMIAIMAGLGLFGGSSGSSGPTAADVQENQGRGTVLGSDEQSSSLMNTMDRYEDLQIDQLFELRGIRDNLRGLSSGITELARSVVAGRLIGEQNYDGQLGTIDTATGGIIGKSLASLDPTGLVGGIISSFSSTKKKLIDSGISFMSQTLGDILTSGEVEAAVYAEIQTTKKKWWGLSKKTSSKTEFKDLDSSITTNMANIFGHINESILGAADLLGFKTVEITKTHWETNFDDFYDEYEDWWGGGYGGNWGRQFGQLVTTTTEMSLEDALADFQINLPKISFEGLTGEEIEKELEAVFSQQADLIAEFLVPSIAQYQQIGEGSYETLLRVAQEQVIFNDHLERTNMMLSDLSSEGMIEVSQSIITLMGGLEEFQSAANAYYDAFFSDEEKFQQLQKSLTEVMVDMGLELPTTREGFRALVESMDLTTEEGQAMYATLLQMAPAMAEYISQLEDMEGVITDYAAAAEQVIDNLRQSIDVEKERAAVALAASQELYNAEIQFINMQRAAVQGIIDNAGNAKSRLEESVDAEKKKLDSQLTEKLQGIQAEKDLATEAHNKKLESLREEKTAQSANHSASMRNLSTQRSAVSKTISSLSSLSKSLDSALNSISGGLTTTQALGELDRAVASARSGDFSFDISRAAQAFTGQQSGQYSSLVDMMRDTGLAQNKIAELSDLTDSQLSVEERTLASLERAEVSANSRNEALLASIDNQMLLESANHEEFLAYLDGEAQKAKDEHQENIDELTAISEDAQARLDALTGIDTSVLSLEDAMALFNAALLEAEFENAQEEFARLDRMEQLALEELELAEQAYQDEIERLDALVTDAEAQLNALLGIDTSIMSVEEAINALASAMNNLAASQEPESDPVQPFKEDDMKYITPVKPDPVGIDLRDEVKRMAVTQDNINRSIAKNTSQSTSILQRIELNGLDTRVEP